jgi:UDP-glucose 4-epimerase
LQKQRNVMKIFYDRMKAELPITLVGSGERQQNFIFIEDIAEACFKVCLKTTAGVYHLVDDKTYTMKELAMTMKAVLNSTSELHFDTSKTEIAINANFDNAKIKVALDWQPKHDLEKGLRKALNV